VSHKKKLFIRPTSLCCYTAFSINMLLLHRVFVRKALLFFLRCEIGRSFLQHLPSRRRLPPGCLFVSHHNPTKGGGQRVLLLTKQVKVPPKCKLTPPPLEYSSLRDPDGLSGNMCPSRTSGGAST
jgi:hypothetical protein